MAEPLDSKWGPLAELHRHLDGSIRPSTLAQLAEGAGVEVPPDLPFVPAMGLEAALARFQFTLSLLQSPDSVKRVASEMCVDAQAEGITTLEIRFAPQLHQGADVSEIVASALDGIAGRAGLILCALYGENPTHVENQVRLGARCPGVVGIDLAGGPAPNHSWAMKDYASAFSLAREKGLGRTVHAGEGRPPEEIRTAIEVLHAQRIGHGTTLLDDSSVMALVLEKGVTIEACPTSNVHTGVIRTVAEHPVARWLDQGIKVTLCTDNTLLSAVTLPQELNRVAEVPGITAERLALCMEHGHNGVFPR
jgi:adenosine deaminase